MPNNTQAWIAYEYTTSRQDPGTIVYFPQAGGKLIFTTGKNYILYFSPESC